MSNQQPKWSANREGDIYADKGAGKLDYVAYAPHIDNARRIVRAVNAHAPMLEALRVTLTTHGSITRGEESYVGCDCDQCVRIRAAIAVGEGRP